MSEAEALRERLDALDQELAERTARANAAVAAAQDTSYWLERWHVDLNALMRRRGAGEARAALRVMRAAYRRFYDFRHQLARRVGSLPVQGRAARQFLANERAIAQDLETDAFVRGLPDDPLRTSSITDVLFSRLDTSDIETIEAALDAGDATRWSAATEIERKRLALAYACHYGVEPALGHGGLGAAIRPEPTGARSTAIARLLYEADLVADALADITDGHAVLGLDYSDGRVLGLLAAAQPAISWHGCDADQAGIDWATENLPEVSFAPRLEDPPLAYDDDAFDAIFSNALWVRLDEPAARLWLAEAHRLLRPGGTLVLAGRGLHALARSSALAEASPDALEDALAAVYRNGFDVRADGTVTFTPEWLLSCTAAAWRLASFHAGRRPDGADIYVLESA